MKKIAVFGFDDFGERVASFLGKKDLIIVVLDEKEYLKAKEKLYDVIKIDSISDEEILKVEKFDIAIAVLKDEEKNLFLCLTLKDLFPDKKLIAKVSEKENEYKYKLSGVDKLINPYEVTANRIMTILKKPLTLKVIEEIIFQDNNLSFAEIEIPKNSFLDGKYIKDIYKEVSGLYNILIIGIVDKEISDEVQFVTKGYNHKIDAGDILIVVGDIDEIERFKSDLLMLRSK
ncbi:MAG TPA: TrkA family potassium uptake protein [Nautiliaceae bacterium]|nr:TrkA family potassium uptake protein [Nautiliaceae bacterium]